MISTISELALFVSRWVELSVPGKATILLIVGLTATWLLGRSRASVRHFFLVATFGTLLALPLIAAITPKMTIDVPLPRNADSMLTPDATRPPTSLAAHPNTSGGHTGLPNGGWSLPSWRVMLRFGWAVGAVVILLSLAAAFWRLRRIRRQGVPWLEGRELMQSLASDASVRRTVEVLLHEGIPAPLTCGVWRPAIILPPDARNWSEVCLRRALIHELEHVRRSDWAVQLVARATCAVYWFHPLIWTAWRRLCLEAERACDDAVVQNSERDDYAEQLVLLAQQMSNAQGHPALGMANRSDLSTRVSALLDGSQPRGRVGLQTAVAALGIASVLVLAIAPLRAVSKANLLAISTSQESRSNMEPSPEPVSATDRALFEAAVDGDLSSINQLLNAGANVNCRIDGDGSPLIGAARNGNLDAARLLLERGADPNMAVRGDGSPLIMAAREGHADVVALLLDHGASVDQMVPEDENASINASGSGHLPVVKLLVSRGANVNAGTWANASRDSQREWRTPLGMARKRGHKDVVEFLVSAGAREE